MKFLTLKIENFLAITEAEIKLADRGLILVQGINETDTSAISNGAGKSSIADALCWVWFGTTARGESGDDVVNSLAGKNCAVTSVVLDGAITYTATRHRKHKTGKNSLTLSMNDGFKTTELTKGTDKLTQEVAAKIIGSSLEVFAGSIYAGQEKMPDLPAMTDKQLKILIEEAAGITVLEEAYKRAREAQLAANVVVVDLEAKVRTVDSSIATCESMIEGSEALKIEFDGRRATRVALMRKEITDAVAEIKEIDKTLALTDRPGLDAKIAAIDAKIAAVSGEQVKLQALSRAMIQAQNLSYNSAQAEVNARTTLQNLTKRLADVDHKVGCPCDSCGRPLTPAELSVTRANHQTAVDKAKKEFTAATIAAEEAENAAQAAEKAHDAFKVTLTDVSAESAERASLEGLRASYDLTLRDRTSRLDAAKRKKLEIADLGALENPHVRAIEQQTKKLKELKDSRMLAENALKEAQTTLAVEQEVVRVFSPAGVRARILDDVTPFLNAQTQKYLATLSDNNIEATWNTLTPGAKKGEFKEKFSIEVVNDKGGKKFGLISGGEKRKVRIATALALQDLVATRALKPIDLFIGDEIDDALDAAGIERMMVILEEKARERGSVFIISHNELKDYVSQVLTIKKTKTGQTKIEEMMV